MFRKFTTSFLAIMTMSSFAYAQEASSQGNSTNFVMIDYGFNLSADATVAETETFSADNPIRLKGDPVDDTNGFVGIGIGHRYANNFSVILRYETGEMESGSNSIDTHPDGGINTAVLGSTWTTDVDSFFIEGAYFVPFTEQIEFWGLVGIGQSEVTTSTNTINIDDGGYLPAICTDSEDNSSTRFGAGATYYLSQSHGFYGGITISNYGDASFKSTTDDDVCGNEPDSMTFDDIEATDLRIGYFRSF